jgi:hypothetical protein
VIPALYPSHGAPPLVDDNDGYWMGLSKRSIELV